MQNFPRRWRPTFWSNFGFLALLKWQFYVFSRVFRFQKNIQVSEKEVFHKIHLFSFGGGGLGFSCARNKKGYFPESERILVFFGQNPFLQMLLFSCYSFLLLLILLILLIILILLILLLLLLHLLLLIYVVFFFLVFLFFLFFFFPLKLPSFVFPSSSSIPVATILAFISQYFFIVLPFPFLLFASFLLIPSWNTQVFKPNLLSFV